jgi:hypothetical protein
VVNVNLGGPILLGDLLNVAPRLLRIRLDSKLLTALEIEIDKQEVSLDRTLVGGIEQ